MTAEANRRLIAEAFEGLSRADATAFVDLMADDFTWVVEGQSRLSRRFEGKAAVRDEMVPQLFANFATPYRNFAEEIIAEGDRVVVLARGEVKTVRGEDYNNVYCFVIRMRDGKMAEIREFTDTAYAESRISFGASA